MQRAFSLIGPFASGKNRTFAARVGFKKRCLKSATLVILLSRGPLKGHRGILTATCG